MARVTVEDCLARVPNRFALTILASRRARMLGEGRGEPMVECDNKEGVTALREISAGGVRYAEDVDEIMRSFIEEQRRQLQVTTGEHTFLEAASLRALEDEEDVDLEEDAEDIDELPSDPEALGKKAKGSTEGDDEDATEGDATVGADSDDDDADTEDEPTFDADDGIEGEIPDDLDDDTEDEEPDDDDD